MLTKHIYQRQTKTQKRRRCRPTCLQTHEHPHACTSTGLCAPIWAHIWTPKHYICTAIPMAVHVRYYRPANVHPYTGLNADKNTCKHIHHEHAYINANDQTCSHVHQFPYVLHPHPAHAYMHMNASTLHSLNYNSHCPKEKKKRLSQMPVIKGLSMSIENYLNHGVLTIHLQPSINLIKIRHPTSRPQDHYRRWPET